ncbi:MAG: hypothetical protein HN802_01170 [Candidatus Jacksonbacteria bacterium]|jgi:hypothetical protein|nr:hypothetical protein [Candidatus Jacksonbacteria bacterium]
MIVKTENKWRVISNTGSGKNFGTYNTELEAQARQRQIDFFTNSAGIKVRTKRGLV